MKKTDFNILVVEDEDLAAQAIRSTLLKRGFSVLSENTGEAAVQTFREAMIDLVLLDFRLPVMDGAAVFAELRKINPAVPVIFMTAYSSVEKAVTLLKMGAYSYLTKPLEMDELLHTIEQALNHLTLERENQQLKQSLQERFSFASYVFNSLPMQNAVNLAARAADSEANILILGESGTGKEVMASIIHQYSKRRSGPLVTVNLSALPETLIEAELFGAERGAFTGATATRIGKFEQAEGGTVFLDEIGELSLEMQVKLLRVIQEREITRLGSNSPVKVNFRLIAATNRKLDQMVQKSIFREDLFFRINVIEISLPPLRERKEDIPLLTDLFIRKFNDREKKEIREISREAMDLLMKYHYPGNIRELENMIERAVILTRTDRISSSDLPVFLQETLDSDSRDSADTLPQKLAAYEKELICRALKNNEFNQSRTAEELGISESGLRYKIQSLKIKNS